MTDNLTSLHILQEIENGVKEELSHASINSHHQYQTSLSIVEMCNSYIEIMERVGMRLKEAKEIAQVLKSGNIKPVDQIYVNHTNRFSVIINKVIIIISEFDKILLTVSKEQEENISKSLRYDFSQLNTGVHLFSITKDMIYINKSIDIALAIKNCFQQILKNNK